jgi:hypothetical protein
MGIWINKLGGGFPPDDFRGSGQEYYYARPMHGCPCSRLIIPSLYDQYVIVDAEIIWYEEEKNWNNSLSRIWEPRKYVFPLPLLFIDRCNRITTLFLSFFWTNDSLSLAHIHKDHEILEGPDMAQRHYICRQDTYAAVPVGASLPTIVSLHC